MSFFMHHLPYIGHLISEKGIQPLMDKIMAIKNLAVPKTSAEHHHFLGLTSYYKKYIPLVTDIAKPFNKLFWKNTKFQLSSQCQAAFDHLKCMLCKKFILQYPNRNKPYTLFIHVSSHAFSNILTQAVNVPGDLRPIAYTSDSFSNAQQWCSATEKKLLWFTSPF